MKSKCQYCGNEEEVLDERWGHQISCSICGRVYDVSIVYLKWSDFQKGNAIVRCPLCGESNALPIEAENRNVRCGVCDGKFHVKVLDADGANDEQSSAMMGKGRRIVRRSALGQNERAQGNTTVAASSEANEVACPYCGVINTVMDMSLGLKCRCGSCNQEFVITNAAREPTPPVNRKPGCGCGFLFAMIILAFCMGGTMSSYSTLSTAGAILTSIPVCFLFVLSLFFWAKRQFLSLESFWMARKSLVLILALVGSVLLACWGVKAYIKDGERRAKDEEQRKKDALIEMGNAIKEGGYYEMARCPHCGWKNGVWIPVDKKGASLYFTTGRLRCESCMRMFERMTLPPSWNEYRK